MAQAARLSLRMHKELKLLLSDPPPGASFPSLSDDSAASLTAIDAQIEGPKGTVYENGYFNIKIQIPERYPFQPPVVTFATPIYHPNIDTGGRICLDILNLPPKGAWQPSLNISTVITSVGLLLSEPNPDDGLMCEASKEYKYNRQAFDQKARSMTEKYAKSKSSGSGNEGFLISSNSIQGGGTDFKNEVREDVNTLKPHSLSRKLSLQSSGSNKNSNDKRLADQPNAAPPYSPIEMECRLESQYDPCNSNGNDGKLSLSEMRKKLSLEGLCQSQKRSSEDTCTKTHTVGGGRLSSQDAGFGLVEKAPVCQKFPADWSDKLLCGKSNSNNIQPVTQPAWTRSCPNLPKTSSSKSLEVNCVELKPSVEDNSLAESKLTTGRPYNKNPCSNKRLNLGYQELKENNKENISQVVMHQTTLKPTYQPSELPSASSSVTGEKVNKRATSLHSNFKNQVIHRRLSLRPIQSKQENHESSNEVNMQNKGSCQKVRSESQVPIFSDVIVMDSEDEEEEKEPVSSKVVVARSRLCLGRKRKAK